MKDNEATTTIEIQPAAATAAATAATAKPRIPRLKGSFYDRLMHKLALLAIAALTAATWWLGASFTLQWIASMGVDTTSHYFWLVPAGITLAEVGLQRAKNPALILIWLVILAFDCYTTAVGLHFYARYQRGIALPILEYVVLTAGSGLLLALSPEHIARNIVQEFKR